MLHARYCTAFVTKSLPMHHHGAMRRVVIVLPQSSYRTSDFLKAARSLRIDAVIATDGPQSMPDQTHVIEVDPRRPEFSAERIVAYAGEHPLDGVVAADDQGVVMAAIAAHELGLRHNSPEAVAATRDKSVMRRAFFNGGVPQPRYRVVGSQDDVGAACEIVGFPVILKPVSLAGSQGVIRIDEPEDVPAVVKRVRAIASDAGCDPDEALLVEGFVPGAEVALEGLLIDGQLEVLAIFDKPDPLDGPYFEETMLVTPSRLEGAVQERLATLVSQAAAAMGLRHGPVHAEARVAGDRVIILEVAARSVGGLCGRSLRFGPLGTSLEVLLLQSALGYSVGPQERPAASGVMMLPIERAGTLAGVGGRERALAVEGITDLTLAIPVGGEVKPLPEGGRYLGFLFARGPNPSHVEQALRAAHHELEIEITPHRATS